ncbi:hypothetical protein [Phenylobacterium sp. J367]|uniref:hypothetical protein n=1 Tax=Phenylobacterium sp. J367 TaxID=2898435 RepID=UPI002150726B|nr:hypothetical protein [Phenylobacterium sp. J367]MCR5877467.1 hypothetical protein [Phenylobacterium sp. J367]
MVMVAVASATPFRVGVASFVMPSSATPLSDAGSRLRLGWAVGMASRVLLECDAPNWVAGHRYIPPAELYVTADAATMEKLAVRCKTQAGRRHAAPSSTIAMNKLNNSTDERVGS